MVVDLNVHWDMAPMGAMSIGFDLDGARDRHLRFRNFHRAYVLGRTTCSTQPSGPGAA
jgi:hypothetical protein